jgi:hypothetical protein
LTRSGRPFAATKQAAGTAIKPQTHTQYFARRAKLRLPLINV